MLIFGMDRGHDALNQYGLTCLQEVRRRYHANIVPITVSLAKNAKIQLPSRQDTNIIMREMSQQPDFSENPSGFDFGVER